MAQDARERLERSPAEGPVLRQLCAAGSQAITGKMLSEAAAAGDALAQEILDRGARALGTGIGNAANLINPQRVVLGGGVTKAGERWWRVLRETATAVALPEVRVEIVPARFADDAPLWGAVALAQDLL